MAIRQPACRIPARPLSGAGERVPIVFIRAHPVKRQERELSGNRHTEEDQRNQETATDRLDPMPRSDSRHEMTDDLAAKTRSWSRGGGGRAAKGARRSGSFRALPPRQDEPGRGMLEFRQQGVPCVVKQHAQRRVCDTVAKKARNRCKTHDWQGWASRHRSPARRVRPSSAGTRI